MDFFAFSINYERNWQKFSNGEPESEFWSGGTGGIDARILNYVTVQRIVTDVFDQVITKIKSRISHAGDVL